jgi:dTDP-glucose pyrophosphorylase/CBS domain-containing protein
MPARQDPTERLERLCVSPAASLRETLRVIDDGAVAFAFVVDPERRLLGTVSDGDARRAILRNVALDAPIEGVMNASPKVARPDEPDARLLERMLAQHVRQMPLVDAGGKLVGVRLLDELVKPRTRPNWAVVMAGGLGERLRPYTAMVPKPLLMVGNQPILERMLRQLRSHGFEKVFLSVNFLAEKIEGYVQDGSAFGLSVDYLRETSRLGTAGSLGLLPERPRDPVVVLNADLMTEISVSALLDFHQEERAALTMCVTTYEIQVPYGVVEVDGSRVRSISEKPRQTWFINAGIYVLDPACFDLIPNGQPLDMPALVDDLLARKKTVASFPVRESWLDIGQLHDYQKAIMQSFGGPSGDPK